MFMDSRVGKWIKNTRTKMPVKLFHLFYGRLCTFFALSVAASSDLSHSPVVSTYGIIIFATQYYKYASASCCLNMNGCNDRHFMGLWPPSLCTFFAFCVAAIQSLSHALAYLYQYLWNYNIFMSITCYINCIKNRT